MSLSALLATIMAPLTLGLSPVAAVKDMLTRDCIDRIVVREAVRSRSKNECEEKRYILM